MKILMAASEMEPFARTGSLADGMLALPRELRSLGHEVSVVLPYYRQIREGGHQGIKSTGVKFPVQIGNAKYPCEILQTTTADDVQVFFIRRDEYFDRTGIYGMEGRDYQDNAERFVFFTKAALEVARRMDPAPEVLHAHDWQTALLPVFVRDQRMPFSTVLTIHDLAVQGNFWSYDFALTNLPAERFSAKGVEYYGSLNCVKGGILAADAVVVPGARVASDVQTPEFGFGLDPVFREHSGKLVGIPIGVDHALWNPASDPLLPVKYTAASLDKKGKSRTEWLKKCGLAPQPSGPVFSLVAGRIAAGTLDVLLPALDRLLADDVRLVLAGAIPETHRRAVAIAGKKHAARMAAFPSLEEGDLHLLHAGSDVTLIPDRSDPADPLLIHALRYGAIPVVRSGGGMYQFVQDFEEASSSGNGFVFHRSTPEAFLDAIRRIRMVWADRPRWRQLQKRAMESDFSWRHVAVLHEEVYASVPRRSVGKAA